MARHVALSGCCSGAVCHASLGADIPEGVQEARPARLASALGVAEHRACVRSSVPAEPPSVVAGLPRLAASIPADALEAEEPANRAGIRPAVEARNDLPDATARVPV